MSDKEKIIQDLTPMLGLLNAQSVAEYIMLRDKKRQGDSVTLDSLKKNPAYAHINIDSEFNKAKMWIARQSGRKLTSKFFVNWLNRIEKPMEGKIKTEREAF
jgi:hypothetical protein